MPHSACALWEVCRPRPNRRARVRQCFSASSFRDHGHSDRAATSPADKRPPEADCAGLGYALEARGDVDAVAHQIAVALLDDVAQMNADAKFYALVGRNARVALDHGVLHFECAAHRVDYAAELDDAAVAGALDDAAVMHGEWGINQI